MNDEALEDGWYLMSVADLEVELRRHREPESRPPPSGAERLSVEAALAYRNAGNLPDERDRTLRLVLHIDNPSDLTYLGGKRLLYEPDYHDAPAWRREGSKPVNVVPLRSTNLGSVQADAWWEDPELKSLEDEWNRKGTIGGLRVPGEYRSFVFKTVLALERANVAITSESVADSIARWVPADEADRIRKALLEQDRG